MGTKTPADNVGARKCGILKSVWGLRAAPYCATSSDPEPSLSSFFSGADG